MSEWYRDIEGLSRVNDVNSQQEFVILTASCGSFGTGTVHRVTFMRNHMVNTWFSGPKFWVCAVYAKVLRQPCRPAQIPCESLEHPPVPCGFWLWMIVDDFNGFHANPTWNPKHVPPSLQNRNIWNQIDCSKWSEFWCPAIPHQSLSPKTIGAMELCSWDLSSSVGDTADLRDLRSTDVEIDRNWQNDSCLTAVWQLTLDRPWCKTQNPWMRWIRTCSGHLQVESTTKRDMRNNLKTRWIHCHVQNNMMWTYSV